MEDAVTVTTWPVMVTGLIYPIPVVYGAVGAGWYNTTIDYTFPPGFLGGPADQSSESHQEFGWHFGGGVELPVGNAGALVADLRYVFLNYEFEQIPGTEVNSDFFVITLGFLFGLQ
jgi:opacity protein-like surface antigen